MTKSERDILRIRLDVHREGVEELRRQLGDRERAPQGTRKARGLLDDAVEALKAAKEWLS